MWLPGLTNQLTIPVISINHYFPVLNLGKHCYCKFCYVMNPIEVTSVHMNIFENKTILILPTESADQRLEMF